MQKKNIYFLLIILIILLAAGGVVYYSRKPAREFLLQKQLGEIIEKKDLAACDKISAEKYSIMCRNAVALALAKEKLDASFCEKMDGGENQINCRKTVLYDKAEQEGVEVCQQAGTETEKRNCEKEYYFTMAIQEADIAQCANLKNEQDQSECERDFSQSQWQVGR